MHGECRLPKRKRHTVLFLTETALQGVNLVCYMAPNIYLLCKPFAFYSRVVSWCGWVRWTCWNTVSLHGLLVCLQALKTLPGWPQAYMHMYSLHFQISRCNVSCAVHHVTAPELPLSLQVSFSRSYKAAPRRCLSHANLSMHDMMLSNCGKLSDPRVPLRSNHQLFMACAALPVVSGPCL